MTSPIPLRSSDNECWCDGSGATIRLGGKTGYGLEHHFCPCPTGRQAHFEFFIDKAGIPARFLGLSFDSYPSQSGASERVREWTKGEEKQGLFLWGGYGCGKTGLATSLLHLRCDFGDGGDFIAVPDLLDRIRSTYGADPVARRGDGETEESLMELWKSSPCLVLDDIGSEKPSEWQEAKLYQLVNYRHGRGDCGGETIFTSNLSLGQLAKRIGERTTWRIAEMCEVIHVEGPNLRDRK